MATRIPFSIAHPLDTGETILAHEILAERASSMGAAAERVEKTIAAMRAAAPDDGARPEKLKAAADSVWAYFVQRELCGFRRHDDVIRDLSTLR